MKTTTVVLTECSRVPEGTEDKLNIFQESSFVCMRVNYSLRVSV